MAETDNRISVPVWRDLQNLVEAATEELLLCTPFFTAEGINRVFDAIDRKPSIQVITRLSPGDWVNGFSDPEYLLALLDLFDEKTLYVHQRLHAKVYIANNTCGFLGSANMTEGGFEHNLELISVLDSSQAQRVVEILNQECNRYAKALSMERLGQWIEQSRESIVRCKGKTSEQPSDLAEAQRALDEMLEFGQDNPPEAVETHAIEEFIGWLRSRPNLMGANIIVSRFDNTAGDNLTGHVKQSYYGSARFLLQCPQCIASARTVLHEDGNSDLRPLPSGVLEKWLDYVDRNASLFGDRFDFAVLRGILPPSLGGTRAGGGGGSSTFKRMIPLVAEFLSQSKHEGE